MDPELVGLVAVVMSGTVGMIWVVGKVIVNVARAKALAAQNQPDGADLERIEDLETRIVELEERVDFTERVLSENKQGQVGP